MELLLCLKKDDSMEDENGIGKLRSVDELQKEMDDAKRENQKNSRFRVIELGKLVILHFSGKVFERDAQINGNATKKLDFELEDKTPDGQNKVFSIGSKSGTARQIISFLRAGKKVLSISREGEGTSTRYAVHEVESEA